MADLAGRVAAISAGDLTLMEDAIEATLTAYDFFFSVPKQTEWPPDQDMLPEEFDSGFEDLGLQDETGAWTDAALPVLVWNDGLAPEAIRFDAVAGPIRQLARQALDTMPQDVMEVLIEDDQSGKPGQWLPHYLSNSWRPEGWLTPAQRRVARTFMANPLAYAIAREIMRLCAVPSG
jgi:hypothetical protein